MTHHLYDTAIPCVRYSPLRGYQGYVIFNGRTHNGHSFTNFKTHKEALADARKMMRGIFRELDNHWIQFS